MPLITETEKAYIGGFLDGEGYFCIGRSIWKPTGAPRYFMYTGATNNSHVVLQWLQGKAGGNIYHKDRNNPAQLRWHISGNKALAFLKEIFPYLIVKSEQAKYCIKFQETRNPAIRELCYDMVITLKSVGNLGGL